MHAWVIGSRAWFGDYEDHLRRDWDLVVTKKNFIEVLQAPGSGYLISGIYYDSIEDGKFRVFTYCPRVIEIEIEDRYKSNKILKFLQASPGITQMADLSPNWKFRLEPISKIACAVLKSSHIFFSVNWRKNALQLAQMRDYLKERSLKELINNEKRKKELSELFDARSRETLARIIRNVKVNNVVALNNEVLSKWDMSVLDKFTPDNELDTDYFPTTESRVSKSNFASSSVEEKHKLINNMLQLIAAMYFNNTPHLNVQEIYMLSLETLCCQQIARGPSTHDKWFRRTQLVYHRENYECSTDEGRVLAPDVLAAIQKSFPDREFELANDEQIKQSTLGNSVIQWLVDNWSMKVLTPSPQFSEFVSQRVPINVPLPILPTEIIFTIFNKTSDHITLSAICRLNKDYRRTFNTNEQWKELVSSIWGTTGVNYGLNVSDNQGQWLKVFQELYNEAKTGPFVYCEHCQYIHSMLSDPPEADINRQEWEWYYCPCPECDAGSWATCGYRSEYLYCK